MRLVERKRKDTKATSPKVRLAMEARRRYNPVVVSGISVGRLVTVPVSEFVHLDVDPAYQRGETTMVGQIVDAIQAGGLVLDPVTLVVRPWSKNDAHKKWIVDGHQRVCAFQQLGVPFQAMIHESASLDAEKQLFVSLNTRNTVSGNTIVKSWTGPGAVALAKANASPSHSLYERVNFAHGTNIHRLPASVVAFSMLVAATGKMNSGAMQMILSRLDVAMGPPERRYLAERFMTLLGEVFPRGTAHGFVLRCLAMAAWDRWSRGGDYPNAAVIARLSKINWKMEMPAFTTKFRPVADAMIAKIWKKEGEQ